MTISIDTVMIISLIIASILTAIFSDSFYGDKKRMGYTYASQIRNSKVVSKANANFFIFVLFASLFLFNCVFNIQDDSPGQNYMDKIMERNDSIARLKEGTRYYNY